MQKHFVTFYSPGTFVAETTTRPIDSWDVDAAMRMAREIKERHGAVPYGFQFTTRSRDDNDLDSTVSARSNLYYLGGKIVTIDEIRARALPEERTLLRNMEGNNWPRIIVNTNSWKWTQPLNDTDVILEWVA